MQQQMKHKHKRKIKIEKQRNSDNGLHHKHDNITLHMT